MRSTSHLIKFFLLDQIRRLCPAKGWRSRAGRPPSPEPAGFSLPGWRQKPEGCIQEDAQRSWRPLETWPGRTGENASFTDGDPRATQLTCPTRWVAEGREGLDETSRVGDSPCAFPAFHQLYGLCSADCPKFQAWTRQSFGRQIPTPLPIESSQKTTLQCVGLQATKVRGKTGNLPQLRPFTSPCDTGETHELQPPAIQGSLKHLTEGGDAKPALAPRGEAGASPSSRLPTGTAPPVQTG